MTNTFGKFWGGSWLPIWNIPNVYNSNKTKFMVECTTETCILSTSNQPNLPAGLNVVLSSKRDISASIWTIFAS